MLGRVSSRSRVGCSRWNAGIGRRTTSSAGTRVRSDDGRSSCKVTVSAAARSSWDSDGSATWTATALLAVSIAGGIINATTHCGRDDSSFQVDQVYDISKVLGEGTYGKVYKAKRKCDGQIVALKTIDQKGTKNDDFDREIKALTILSENGGHPHVCRLFDIHKDKHYYYLAMELIEGGELFEHLIEHGAYSEQDAAKFLNQHAQALAYMESVRLVHSDLKPENLMLSSWEDSKAQLKVVDFGSALPADTSVKGAKISGTVAYWPPEMFDQESRKITPSLDVFATGVILYILLTGTHPFDPRGDATDEEVSEIIQDMRQIEDLERLAFDDRTKGLSTSCTDLLKALMDPNPKTRMTPQQLLRHPWVQGVTASPQLIVDSDKKLALFWQKRFRAAILKKYATATGGKGSLSDENLRDIFRAIDLDGSGDISPEELKAALSGLIGQNDMDDVFRSLDADRSGSIDYDEFCTIMRKQFQDGEGVRIHKSKRFRAAILRRFEKASNKSLRYIFNAIDVDGNGMLSIEELQLVLSELGIGKEEISDWVDSIDSDLNGGVDFEEFRASMEGLK